MRNRQRERERERESERESASHRRRRRWTHGSIHTVELLCGVRTLPPDIQGRRGRRGDTRATVLAHTVHGALAFSRDTRPAVGIVQTMQHVASATVDEDGNNGPRRLVS